MPFGALSNANCGRWISCSRGTRFEGWNRTPRPNPDGHKWHGLAKKGDAVPQPRTLRGKRGGWESDVLLREILGMWENPAKESLPTRKEYSCQTVNTRSHWLFEV
jgi:hypothetical protein